MYRCTLLLLIILTFSCTTLAADPPWIARSKLGMVASDSPEASQIGADVLAGGGNAFDAAIATSFALAVARPHSTGLGGGGFLLAYVAEQQDCTALDFRESAPAAATRDRYIKLHADRGDGPSPSIYGGNAIAVPGQLAGLAEIHKKYGTKPWAELVAPAIKLCHDGFVVDKSFRGACKDALADYQRWPELRKSCGRLYETLLNNGDLPEIGTRIRRPNLARALQLIVEHGADAMRTGPLAEAVVKAANNAGGKMTLADLADYRVKPRSTLRASLASNCEVFSMPPPSSGGICLIQMLEHYNHVMLSSLIREWSRPYHMMTESMKHAFADRARWLGDPDFADVPTERLISREHINTQKIDYNTTHPPEWYGGTLPPPDDSGTSHFCVADRFGNVVSQTETINGTFGSLVVAEPFGVILNNEMDDFATNPGQPNMFGLIQGEANAVAPGKRPLSSMTPTIVTRDGKPILALGASGGPRIITSVYQVLIRATWERQDLATAMQALRLHHQWLPNEIYFDRAPQEKVEFAGKKRTLVEYLESYGHKIATKRKTGIVQAIQIQPDGTMIGASDPRKGGRPAAPAK